MPCRYFEPSHPATSPSHMDARLPLIQEYDGQCHAIHPVAPAPSDVRFRCCNHGYSRGVCGRFPDAEASSAFRYHVVRQTPQLLEVLCIEEVGHYPGRSFHLIYDLPVAALRPAELDLPLQAQAAAFCHSYLQRCFPPATD